MYEPSEHSEEESEHTSSFPSPEENPRIGFYKPMGATVYIHLCQRHMLKFLQKYPEAHLYPPNSNMEYCDACRYEEKLEDRAIAQAKVYVEVIGPAEP